MSSGTLYVVATPIGNLEDLSMRAVRVLREVAIIACEDTRHTRVLLQHYGVATPILSYHEHNEAARTPELLRRLEAGASVALVSDAGTPILSDPGFTLLRHAIATSIPVVPIPGPSAITTALSVAGLPTDRFVFVGFLPRRTGERRRILAALASVPWTVVLFEAPHRIRQTLQDLKAILGDRQMAVGRELTKKFEEMIRGAVSQVLEHVQRTPPRGELTLVVAGAPAAAGPRGDPARRLRALLARGVSAKDAVRQVAQTCGLPRRTVYEMALHLQGKRRGAP
jgi:16S rRNA (cytidine1402-2'-O)-methyltransferase